MELIVCKTGKARTTGVQVSCLLHVSFIITVFVDIQNDRFKACPLKTVTLPSLGINPNILKN